MGHGVAAITEEDIKEIVTAKPVTLSGPLKFVLWAIVVVGVIAFIQGTINDSVHAWASFHVNFTYWLVAAAASTCFSAVLTICNGQWARPIRRIFEASSRFLFISIGILVVLYFGHHKLFVWADHPVPGKEVWLTSQFVYLRDILGLIVLALLANRIVFYSIQRDIGAIRGGLTGVDEKETERWFDKRYDKYVAGWGKDFLAEIEEVTKKKAKLSPVTMLVFSLVLSFIAFDQIMSVDPHWYSTLFGVLYFMSGAYIAMAWCAIVLVILQDHHSIFKTKVKKKTLHDLGKLMFGFGIFWAYMFWSHYLPIWYGNLPEETGWVIVRMREQPWHDFSWMVLGCCFIVPFLIGLSRDVKQIPTLLMLTAVIVAGGVWLMMYLLFVPTLFPNVIPLNILDVGIALGFMAGYLLSIFSFLEKVPLIPFGDMY